MMRRTDTILILVIAVMAFFLYREWSANDSLRRDLVISNQNAEALADSITLVVKENGDLNASKDAFIATEKDLRKLNKRLSDKVDEQSGKLVSLGDANVRLKQEKEDLEKFIDERFASADTTIQLNDSTYLLGWSIGYTYDSTNFDRFRGETTFRRDSAGSYTHVNTALTQRETAIDITFGQKVEDDKLRVFVESPYPGFSVNSLDGVLIDPDTNPYLKKLMKKKRWFTGFHVGVGATYGMNAMTGTPGFVVGPTITWSIYNTSK